MPISKKLALSAEQLEEIMTSTWNMRIATIGPGTRINLTPMWFGWGGGKVFTFGRGQKVINVRRTPACSVIVDRNEKFPELQAAMFQGHAHVLESADAEQADPDLEAVRLQMGIKYAGGHGGPAPDTPEPNRATARGKHNRWIVFTPDKLITWDNFKLNTLRKS
ncbi:MAG: pyridoxamine 5'-phosphate oxidase family protein [Pseudomonadales bacterium]|nr:pyridoxamine 5'-phosphate oxidase family protein [Pseudomonadales bacterium]MDP7360517.1 pyridoxamine 5'-phosphate oxidase family protein [Pseudomonadales bacterium]MDP7594436.1 pyridoxamine 5'-phosphate oxidase family protein [Pseudomonadales bacterium]